MKELPEHVAHGSKNAYTNYKCRCEECREANAASASVWRTDNREKYTDYQRAYMRRYRERKRQEGSG